MDIRDQAIFTNAAWGLPKAVVDGSAACDLIVVARAEPMRVVRVDVSLKERKFVCYPEEGVCRLDVSGAERDLSSLTHAQAVALARMAVAIERHYDTAQDIEWAINPQGVIYLLQCRPLQQKPAESGSPVLGETPTDDASVFFRGGRHRQPRGGLRPGLHRREGLRRPGLPEGAVLVVRQALPRWASLLSRAAAVVSEEGGFAGHLANVAREFGGPRAFRRARKPRASCRRERRSRWTPPVRRCIAAAPSGC